jgi:hypothetical protein
VSPTQHERRTRPERSDAFGEREQLDEGGAVAVVVVVVVVVEVVVEQSWRRGVARRMTKRCTEKQGDKWSADNHTDKCSAVNSLAFGRAPVELMQANSAG